MIGDENRAMGCAPGCQQLCMAVGGIDGVKGYERILPGAGFSQLLNNFIFHKYNGIFVKRFWNMSEKEMNSYRFGYNVEPTDEMLAQIMKEVAEEARESNKRALDELFEKLRQDVEEDAKMMTEPITCSVGEEKPELIIIAGTNGAGKTLFMQKLLQNECTNNTTYININEDYCAEWRERCIEEKQSFVFTLYRI